MKCPHTSRLSGFQQRSKITLYKKFPSRYTITAVMSHRLEVCFYLQLTVKSQSPLSFKLPFSFFLPSVKQKIICTLSPTSTHTSNFPRLIQPSTPYASVRYNWRGRGHAETSIKGSQLSKVPLCVVRSYISVVLLSELPVEFSLHPVHSELLLFH